MEKLKVRLTTTDELLGSLPGDSEIYRSFIASKAPKPQEIMDEELASIDIDEEFEKGCTIFARNEDGDPILYDYVIKGFFKNACKAMREADGSASKALKAYKTKIDNLIFVGPRQIKINTDKEISICERPLRASTAQGDRVALAASECIAPGAVLEFEIECLSKDLMKMIIEWLDYGKFNGLGQWHNSGKGRFTWEDITEK